MDAKTLISQVREEQAKFWQNSDLWQQSEDMLEAIVDHLEQCPACREAFDARQIMAGSLQQMQAVLLGTSPDDWVCESPAAAAPYPDLYQIAGYEVLEAKPKPFGAKSAHISLPGKYLGKRLKIVLIEPLDEEWRP